MADYQQSRRKEGNEKSISTQVTRSQQRPQQPSLDHQSHPINNYRQPSPSDRHLPSQARTRERERWSGKPKTSILTKSHTRCSVFNNSPDEPPPMLAEQVWIPCMTKEEHPHFMRSLSRQSATPLRLDKPQNMQEGAVHLTSQAKRNWACLRVAPSLVVTPSVVRYNFSTTSDKARLTLINNQPLRQVAYFIAPQPERIEIDFWKPEAHGINFYTVQTLQPPPPPFVAETLKLEWQTTFYTLSLGKHVAIEQQIRAPRIQKAKYHIAKRELAVKQAPREYRRLKQPEGVIHLRAFPPHSIRLSTVEDPSNQYRVGYISPDGMPILPMPMPRERSGSRPRETDRRPIKHTKNVPRPSRGDGNPVGSAHAESVEWMEPPRDFHTHRRVSPRRQICRSTTPSNYDRPKAHVKSSLRRFPDDESSCSSQPRADYRPRPQHGSPDDEKPQSPAHHRLPQPRNRSLETKTNNNRPCLRIESVVCLPSKRRPGKKSRERRPSRPSRKKRDAERRQRKSKQPRIYHVDVEIDYDDENLKRKPRIDVKAAGNKGQKPQSLASSERNSKERQP